LIGEGEWIVRMTIKMLERNEYLITGGQQQNEWLRKNLAPTRWVNLVGPDLGSEINFNLEHCLVNTQLPVIVYKTRRVQKIFKVGAATPFTHFSTIHTIRYQLVYIGLKFTTEALPPKFWFLVQLDQFQEVPHYDCIRQFVPGPEIHIPAIFGGAVTCLP
jgi:hypothetical protein